MLKAKREGPARKKQKSFKNSYIIFVIKGNKRNILSHDSLISNLKNIYIFMTEFSMYLDIKVKRSYFNLPDQKV